MLDPQAQSLILQTLLRRRAQVMRQLDDALAQPGSYSIQGSYSETARSVADYRDQVARLDAQIRAIASGQGDVTYNYPTKV
jgi:hypothetical protein